MLVTSMDSPFVGITMCNSELTQREEKITCQMREGTNPKVNGLEITRFTLGSSKVMLLTGMSPDSKTSSNAWAVGRSVGLGWARLGCWVPGFGRVPLGWLVAELRAVLLCSAVSVCVCEPPCPPRAHSVSVTHRIQTFDGGWRGHMRLHPTKLLICS